MTTSTEGLIFILIDATVKATVLLALAALPAVLCRRASASSRHLVWALGLACALCLPLLSWNLPHWRVALTVPAARPGPATETAPLPKTPRPVPTAVAPTVSSHATAPVTAAADTQSPPPQAARVDPPTLPAASPTPRLPWTAWVVLAWAAGTILVLAQLARGLACVTSLTRHSVPPVETLVAQLAPAADAMRVARPVALRQASNLDLVSVPLTFGALRPVIVLPASVRDWPEERTRAALLHEMAHVRRWDWALQVMAHAACALYWFHPLVWLAARKMRVESETACDDLVLLSGMPAPDYARHLLDVALSVRQQRRAVPGAVAMAQTAKVEGRLRRVLAAGLARRPLTRRRVLGAGAAALVLALPLAALRLVAQAQPVPAADGLQLRDGFTLRYAATITDLETTQAQLRQYQQLRADYQKLLQKDPYFQPVPGEFYGPFSYFQSRRPRTRHLTVTVSAHGGRLLYRTEEDGDTFTYEYDGHGTQMFWNGHAGRTDPGLEFDRNCPLPAVGLPHLPLLKRATLVGVSGAQQTWYASSPLLGASLPNGEVTYLSSLAHAVNDGGTWKVLSVDGGGWKTEYLQHQRLQGLWIASRLRTTQYEEDTSPSVPRRFSGPAEFMAWVDAHRTPTSVCEYRLISSGDVPLDPRSVSAPRGSAPKGSARAAEDLYVQEALHLRYRLQGWAQGHRALLQQMAQAQPNDPTAATRIDQSLRALPFPLWEGDPRPGHVWDGDPRTGHGSQKPLFTAEYVARQGGSTSRDFEIARSRNAGAVHVVLWASGRITRSTTVRAAGTERQEEIVPAFFGDDGTSNMAADAPEAVSVSSPNRSVGQRPDTAAHHIALGQQLQRKGQPRDGIPEFRRAVRLDPNNAEAQLWLAFALDEINDERTGHKTTGKPAPSAVLDEAIAHMQRAVALRPAVGEWHFVLGTFLAQRGKDAQAVAQYRLALRLLPSAPTSGVGTGDAAPATRVAQAVFDARWSLGDALLRLGQDQDAVPEYHHALEFNPTAPWVLLGLGKALDGVGRHAEARAAWERVIAVAPPETYYWRQARTMLAQHQ